jgi:heptosyltransferase-3
LRLASASPLVGLQVRAFPTKAWRDWPIEHFAALCKRIRSRWGGAHFLLFGGPEDRPRTDELVKLIPEASTSLAGQLDLRESAAVMNELGLFIGLDSGPTHIMGALEAPMIALYHCLAPGRFMQPLERARCYVVDHPRSPQACDADTPMGEIPVDLVWDRVVEALG